MRSGSVENKAFIQHSKDYEQVLVWGFMSIRYSDMSLETSGALDFVARQRTPSAAQLAITIISVFIIAASVSVSINNQTALLATLFVIFVALGWYVIYTIIRSRDVVLATEFQNSIFASALGLNNKFNLIIKRDGTIVYLDRAFQNLFPDFTKQANRSLDSLLRTAKIAKASVEQIHATLDKGEYGKVIMDVTDAQGNQHRVVLSVEPILRPAGFIMLRGREYIVERKDGGQISSSSAPSSLLDKSSITLFSPVMESMNLGIYITSPDGQVVYSNGLLEQWLSYDDGEIATRNLTIDRLVPPARNSNFDATTISFEGNVQMEKKVGGFINVFLNQKIIYGEGNKPVGCTAIIHLLEDGASLAKKKSGSGSGDEF